jgi:hypothetical protein
MHPHANQPLLSSHHLQIDPLATVMLFLRDHTETEQPASILIFNWCRLQSHQHDPAPDDHQRDHSFACYVPNFLSLQPATNQIRFSYCSAIAVTRYFHLYQQLLSTPVVCNALIDFIRSKITADESKIILFRSRQSLTHSFNYTGKHKVPVC